MNRLNVPFLLMFVVTLAVCSVVASAQTEGKTNLPTVTPVLATQIPTVEATEETPQGDAENGAVLFSTFQPAAGIACATCHRIDSDDRLVGPGLLHVGERAATRREGYTAAEYIRESILTPGAYVVPDYPDIMPKNFSKVFTPDQIDDLVAFLLTLSEND